MSSIFPHHLLTDRFRHRRGSRRKPVPNDGRPRHLCRPWSAACLAFAVLLGLPLSFPAIPECQEDAEQLISLGPIAYSSRYSLDSGGKAVTFIIRNDTGSSISDIFARIYWSQDNPGSGRKRILLNNPHRGGMESGGNGHPPGKKIAWRFPLQEPPPANATAGKLVLQVNSRAIFYDRSFSGLQ